MRGTSASCGAAGFGLERRRGWTAGLGPVSSGRVRELKCNRSRADEFGSPTVKPTVKGGEQMRAPYKISRRSLLQGSAGMALAARVIGGEQGDIRPVSAPVSTPNLLIILADDLGYGDLSSYGAGDLRSPNIDGLMAAGVRFDSFYANSPVCSPTRAALLSGRYPDRVGVPGVIRGDPANNWGYLSPRAVLIPEPLKAAGYHTALVGKWHLGLESPNTPRERGFDFFHGFLDDMMDDYYDHRRYGRNYMRYNEDPIEPEGHATDLFTEWAIDYLQARKADKRKFFLYLAYNAPHIPIQPPADWLEKVRKREPGLGENRAKLVALIEHMDAGIGRVITALKKNGQFDNTLIVFASDNGGEPNAGATSGKLRGGKRDMYEGGIRVPMCAVWPGRIAPGSRSAATGMTMDLLPTLCEAAGAASPRGLDGVSLLPVMRGQAQHSPERDLIWVRREGRMPYQGRDYYALRRANWKLVQNNPFEPYRLFNLGRDPREEVDLAASEPEVCRELASALMRHIQAAGQTPWQRPDEDR